MKQGQKNKAPLAGTASLNLSEYARVTDQREFEINIPLTLSACIASEPHPLLCVRSLVSYITSLLHQLVLETLFVL